MTSRAPDRPAMSVVAAANEHDAPPLSRIGIPVAVDVSEDARRAGVQQAFALGWHVAELCYRQDREHVAPSAGDSLRQLGALDSTTRLRLLIAQISADLDGVGLERSGPVRPLRGMGTLEDRTADPLADLDTIDIQPGRMLDVQRLHTAILLRLTVKDYELGKGYSLGASLGQTVFQAYERVRPRPGRVLTLSEAREALREVFTHDRVVELWSAIKDLKSRFPPYAADPVATTLWDWCLWAGAHMSGRMAHEGEAGDGDLVASRLRRQGQTWRALLSGERKPTDCLQFGNYAEAAGHLLRNYWKLVGRGLGRRWGTVLFVLLMVAVAVAVAVAVQQVAHSYVASLAGALTALGVTGASAVAALKRALDQAEHALWETEMAAAVAVAIGFVPQRLPHSAAARLATDDPRPIGPALER